eukprot:scaffold22980_cov52-Cyclotella_meneghiniana.AAC.3
MTSIEEIAACVELNGWSGGRDEVEQQMTLSQIDSCIAEFDATEHLATASGFRTANLKRDASAEVLKEGRSCLKRIKSRAARPSDAPSVAPSEAPSTRPSDAPSVASTDLGDASASLTGVVSESEISTKQWSEDEIEYLKTALIGRWNALERDVQQRYPKQIREAFEAFVGTDGKDPSTSRLSKLEPDAWQSILVSIFTYNSRNLVDLSDHQCLCILGAFGMLHKFYKVANKYELKEDKKRRSTYQNGQKRMIPRFVGNNKRNLIVQWNTPIHDPAYKNKKDVWKFLGNLKVSIEWYTFYYFVECYKRKDRLAAWSDEANWISDLQRGFRRDAKEVSHLDGLVIKKLEETKDCNPLNSCLEAKFKNQWRRTCEKRWREQGQSCTCTPRCIYAGAPRSEPHLEMITN